MTGRPDSSAPIGDSVPRSRALRFLDGRGRYSDDISLPRMVHVAFLRSPHPHARIVSIDAADAQQMPGVIRIVTGAEIATHCKPYAGIHQLFAGMRAPDQLPLAVDRACWQGEPVVAVVAATRAEAEDAAEAIALDWEQLPALTDPRQAMQSDCLVIHPQLGSNVVYQGTVTSGDVGEAFARAAAVVEGEFRFGRHTGVCLEPRTIIADYTASDGTLTVHQSHQCPAQQQDIYGGCSRFPNTGSGSSAPMSAAHSESSSSYGDELAVCVLSKILQRPAKFVADRIESFSSDVHAREHVVTARLAVAANGRFLGMEAEDCFGIGAYSQYPRSSIGEGSHVLRMSGAPYILDAYRVQLSMVLQNKNMVGHYRSVGHPIAVAVTSSWSMRRRASLVSIRWTSGGATTSRTIGSRMRRTAASSSIG